MYPTISNACIWDESFRLRVFPLLRTFLLTCGLLVCNACDIFSPDYTSEICVVRLINTTFVHVMQPHKIPSKVVFRPLSMDERPTVVLGLLALWTGPEQKYQQISAELWRIVTLTRTEAAAHLCFCCPFRLQQGLPTDGTAHGRSPKFGGSCSEVAGTMRIYRIYPYLQ